MKIAVTGASGFIGEEVLEVLMGEPGTEVIALSRSKKDTLPGGPVWRQTDYTPDSLAGVLGDVDAIIHLAAVRGTAGTLADYSINEVITENLLIAAGECGVNQFVFASSIAVYSDTSMMPWTEEMRLSPKTLYGITKAACEHLIQYYSRKYGFRYAIVRIAQVLGTGERRRVMTNVFMEQAAAGGQLRVMGRSVAKRQYIYSRDLAGILADLARKQTGPVIMNAGMEEAHTNLEIARMVNEAYGNDVPVDYDDSTEETIEPSIMSTDLYRQLMDRPVMTMQEALADIARRES